TRLRCLYHYYIFISRNLTTLTHSQHHEIPFLQTVRTLCAQDQLHEALSLFYTINHHNPSHSLSQTFAALFHACAKHNFLTQGQLLHRHLLAIETQKPNLFITNHLINMYSKCGRLDISRKLFDEMSYRNLVSWTALITGYDQWGYPIECFRVFRDMFVEYRPNEFAFGSVLASCDRDRGRQVHALALKTCFDCYVYVGNALISMYSKNYDNVDDENDDGYNVFLSMASRNMVTWNSMISGFQVRGLGGRCFELFNKMRSLGVGFDRSTLVSAANCLCLLEHFYLLHCLAIKFGLVIDVEVVTALVKVYSDLGGDVHECYKLFLETSGSQDVVSWTGIIAAFAERESEEALLLFSKFSRECLDDPDRYIFSSVIKACAGLATERHCSTVHAQVMKYGFESDTVLANGLIHAYSRCGSIELSMQVFDSMEVRDIVSWNSMLKAYSVHGRGRAALHLSTEMDIQPDAATFVALLSACSHAGLVEEGTKIFNTMFGKYGIIPQCDHFATMVDILGRAGRIVEAESLIKRMPIEPDSVVWSALLGACKKHGETKIAELALTKLMELNPNNSLGYTLMSNIYCSRGSFNNAALVRKEMQGSKVRKEPGLSWIEIGNRVYEFASGGRESLTERPFMWNLGS
ncbi:hypothetical protein GIB67_016756, partial [Kingdonia uniflora]